MFKRYLVACKDYHCISLISLLTFILGYQTVSAQQQVAVDTYAIFQQSCLICHGPDGAYKETLLMEHDALIENRSVVPGNPDESELYKRLITTETAKRMPHRTTPTVPSVDCHHPKLDSIRCSRLGGNP